MFNKYITAFNSFQRLFTMTLDDYTQRFMQRLLALHDLYLHTLRANGYIQELITSLLRSGVGDHNH